MIYEMIIPYATVNKGNYRKHLRENMMLLKDCWNHKIDLKDWLDNVMSNYPDNVDWDEKAL